MSCYSYAAIGPAGNFYEVCQEDSPSLYQDYGERNHLLSVFHYCNYLRIYTECVVSTSVKGLLYSFKFVILSFS